MLIVYNAVKLCHKVDKEMPPDSYASDLNLDQLKISVNVNKRSLHCKFATKEISSGTAPSIFFYKRSQQSYQKVRSNKCIRWLIGLSVTIIPITSLKKHVVTIIPITSLKKHVVEMRLRLIITDKTIIQISVTTEIPRIHESKGSLSFIFLIYFIFYLVY